MKKEKEDFVKVCPKCFSTQVTLTDNPLRLILRELHYRCKNCGLQEKTFPEFPISELKKIADKKEVKQNVAGKN